MRKAFLFLAWLLLSWAPATAVLASFDDSRLWFEQLSNAERSATQTELILLGHYNYLVDGQFGRGTFDAISAFQKSRGRAGTGILSEPERHELGRLAADVNSRLGMELVSDAAAHVAMMIPARLLSIRNPSEVGTSYVSADGEFSLETMHASLAEQSFEQLFEVLTAPDPERIVTYRSFGAERFVVSGRIEPYSFYTMFVRAGDEAVGYSLAWGQTYAEEGAITSVFVASHFKPLANLPPSEETKKSTGTGGGTPHGAFVLPADQPELIVLNADITGTTAAEFLRALAARPAARIIVLNSPGGAVDAALQMAYEIRRRGLSTYVPAEMGCYSACAYIFLAGADRSAVGELGVHQISAEVADLVLAQMSLGDVLDALEEFGTHQQVISHMLRTPPDSMYVFSSRELDELAINAGDPIEVAIALPSLPLSDPGVAVPIGVGAFVQLGSQPRIDQARRSLDYAAGRWGKLFGDARPEVEDAGEVYRIRLPMPSLERANAICAAIKADGGGCYVTSAGG